MTLTAIIEVVFWPATAFGLFMISVPWTRYVELPWAWWIAYLVMASFAPIILLIFVTYNQSVRLLLAQDALWVALGIGMLRYRKQDKHRVRRILAAIFGVMFFAIGTWWMIGDYLLPRQNVIGTIDRIEYRFRYGPRYHLRIGKDRYPITYDLVRSLREGQRVKLEFGQGSGSVFHVVPQ